MTSPAMDNHEKISGLILRLDDFDEKPSSVLHREEPGNFVKYAWIPQTICDQIWVLYEFRSKEDREEWEKSCKIKSV